MERRGRRRGGGRAGEAEEKEAGEERKREKEREWRGGVDEGDGVGGALQRAAEAVSSPARAACHQDAASSPLIHQSAPGLR